MPRLGCSAASPTSQGQRPCPLPRPLQHPLLQYCRGQCQ
jgi:hypothetical protein